MTNFDQGLSWKDCLTRYEDRFRAGVKIDFAEEAKQLGLLSMDSKLQDLLLVYFEVQRFDFKCLVDAVAQLQLTEPAVISLLQEAHRHMTFCDVPALWNDFAMFGFSPEALKLGLRDDSHYLGQRVGSYTIKERIARGSAVTVFRAVRERDGLEVSLRIPSSRNLDIVSRIEKECQLRSEFNIEGIPRLIEVTPSENGPIAVCEYIYGVPLDRCDYVLASVSVCVAVSARVAEILEGLHCLGLVVEDVKPANILITRHDQIYLVDLNSLRKASDTSTISFASPGFMSPEQLNLESEKIEAATDIYSLGATLESLLSKCIQKGSSELKVPEEVQLIVDSAKSLSPLERYASAGHFKLACQRFLDGKAVLLPPELNQSLMAWRAGFAMFRCDQEMRQLGDPGLDRDRYLEIVRSLVDCLNLLKLLEWRDKRLATSVEKMLTEISRVPDTQSSDGTVALKQLEEYSEFFRRIVCRRHSFFPPYTLKWLEVSFVATNLVPNTYERPWKERLWGAFAIPYLPEEELLDELFCAIENSETSQERDAALAKMDRVVTQYIRWRVDETSQKMGRSIVPAMENPRTVGIEINPEIEERLHRYSQSRPNWPRKTR